MATTRAVGGVVVRGHGVASGASVDPRFPDGTLRLQFPIFSRLGVDIDGFHPGTVNVALDDPTFDPGPPDHLLRSVAWHPDVPAEDFSLWRISLFHDGVDHRAMIYRPHPETKPDHHQPPGVVEVLAEPIDGLTYGDRVTIARG